MNITGTGFPRNRIDPTTFFIMAAIGLGILVSALVHVSESWIWPVAFVAGLLLVWLVIKKPDWGLAILVFVIYTRSSDIMERESGVPSFVLPLALLLLAVIVARWWFWGETIHNWEQAAILIGIYGFVGFISLFYAADPARSENALVQYAKDGLILMTVVFTLRRRASLHAAVWALVLAGLFMGTLTVYQQLTGTFENDYGGFAKAEVKNIVGQVSDFRVAGPVGATNFYAMILVVLVPLAWDRLWQEKSWTLRLLSLWCLVVCVLSIIFTFSRGGFLALCLVGLFIMIHQSARPRRILLAVALLALLLPVLPANYTERLVTTLDLFSGDSNDARNETSFRGRTSEVVVAWRIFTDHPIWGVGLKNYKYYYQDYAQPLGWDKRREERSAHNLFLEIAAETGLVGLAAFGAIVGNAFYGLRRAGRSLTQQGRYNEAGIAWALAVGLAGYLASSFFLHGAYPRYFWLLIGIALALPQIVALSSETKTVETESASPPLSLAGRNGIMGYAE